MGYKPEMKNSSLREKAKYFIMLKYQVLPQQVSLHFLCRILTKLGSDLSLFRSKVIFSLQFWHRLEPCHSAFCWLSSHWLGSWRNFPHQWCPVSSPSRQLLLLMGAEKLWWSEENSLQLHLGGSQPISMTGQNYQRRSEWATRNEDPRCWAPTTSSDPSLPLTGGKKKEGAYLRKDNSLPSSHFLLLLHNIVYESVGSATQ